MRSLAGLVLGALACVGTAAGCSESSSGSPAADAGAVCPATVDAAVGHACGVEGLSCSPLYACGLVAATATCTCQGGLFSCADVMGKALGAGDAPACPPLGAGQSCPATESAAKLSNCTEPGLLCSYPSTCPEARYLDTCECFTGKNAAGTSSLHFQCSTACPAGDASALPVDSGADTEAEAAPADARPDSPAEAASPGGDASIDARTADGAAD